METPKRGTRGVAGIGSRGGSSLRASTPGVEASREGPLRPPTVSPPACSLPAARVRLPEPSAPRLRFSPSLKRNVGNPPRARKHVCVYAAVENVSPGEPQMLPLGPRTRTLPRPPCPWEPRLLTTPRGYSVSRACARRCFAGLWKTLTMCISSPNNVCD